MKKVMKSKKVNPMLSEREKKKAWECGLCDTIMPLRDYRKYGHICNVHAIERKEEFEKLKRGEK